MSGDPLCFELAFQLLRIEYAVLLIPEVPWFPVTPVMYVESLSVRSHRRSLSQTVSVCLCVYLCSGLYLCPHPLIIDPPPLLWPLISVPVCSMILLFVVHVCLPR